MPQFGPGPPKTQEVYTDEGAQTGAGWGAGIGGLLAALAVPFTGGMSLAALPAMAGAASIGAMGGGLLGRAGGSIYDYYNPEEVELQDPGSMYAQQAPQLTPMYSPPPPMMNPYASASTSQPYGGGMFGGMPGGGGPIMAPPPPFLAGYQSPSQMGGYMPLPYNQAMQQPYYT